MDRKYGRAKDFADYRDTFLPPRFRAVRLPPVVDERASGGPIKDQRHLGSCTGHAGSESLEWQFRKYLKAAPILSPLNLYVNELRTEGTFPDDNGAMPRTICQVLKSIGVCEESVEPYTDKGGFTAPTDAQTANAAKYKIGGYHRLQGLQDVLLCLGDPTPWPVLIGFDVYESFETDIVSNTGKMPTPDTKREQLLGGHEVLGLGYNMADKVVICQNSYGAAWGDKGFFYMPFEVIGNADMVSDLWIAHVGSW